MGTWDKTLGGTLGDWALGRALGGTMGWRSSRLDYAEGILWLTLVAAARRVLLLSPSEVLYVFGGFDGGRELGDFWRFDVRSSSWFQICSDAVVMVSLPRNNSVVMNNVIECTC